MDVRSFFWTVPARAEPAPSRATAAEVRMMALVKMSGCLFLGWENGDLLMKLNLRFEVDAKGRIPKE